MADDNLEALGEALGRQELTLVGHESRVESFRANNLAVADDGSDDGLPAIVDNQYGRTSHGNLGKLIAAPSELAGPRHATTGAICGFSSCTGVRRRVR